MLVAQNQSRATLTCTRTLGRRQFIGQLDLSFSLAFRSFHALISEPGCDLFEPISLCLAKKLYEDEYTAFMDSQGTEYIQNIDRARIQVDGRHLVRVVRQVKDRT